MTDGKRKFLFVMGARPNFVKMAPLARHFLETSDLTKVATLRLVHTGQHTGPQLNDTILKDLRMPGIDFLLSTKPGSHAVQTASIMVEFEKLCLIEKPDGVLVVGDVNSTVACALVAKKLGVELSHVEAGLRSFNRDMPEEINRLATDSISDLLFTTSPDADRQLLKEGVDKSKIHFVGNLLVDALTRSLPEVGEQHRAWIEKYSLPSGQFCLLTLHRPSNVDEKKPLVRWFEEMKKISAQLPVVFAAHPRTQKKIKEFGLSPYFDQKRLIVIPPLSYLEILAAYQAVAFVMTDSGGVQEETTALAVPCVTLRGETERPITVSQGSNTVVGEDSKELHGTISKILGGKYKSAKRPKFWDGRTAERIWKILTDR